jgi:hypothetical protein
MIVEARSLMATCSGNTRDGRLRKERLIKGSLITAWHVQETSLFGTSGTSIIEGTPRGTIGRLTNKAKQSAFGAI